MGKITLTVEGSTVGYVESGGGVVCVTELSDEDSARIVAAMADQQMRRPGQQQLTIPTTQQIVQTWWDRRIADVKNEVIAYEQRKAMEEQQARRLTVSTIFNNGVLKLEKSGLMGRG